MKEAKKTKPQVPSDLQQIRAMRTVKWAKVKGRYLYFCTKPHMLRHRSPTPGQKYLPQIIVRMDMLSTGAQPYFQYFWGGFGKKRHEGNRMESGGRIGNWEQGYMHGCLGEYDVDYIRTRREEGLKAGAELLIQMLQSIY